MRLQTHRWRPSRPLPLFSLFSLVVLLLLSTRIEAQVVQVDGVPLEGTQSNLNLTVDIIEFRQGEEPVVHLTTGKRHYGLALVSQSPIAMFDAEFSSVTGPPRQFTVRVEDGRESSGCLVSGLKSSGEDPAHHLIYALACESVNRPPVQGLGYE
jgi:hypothetical protein